MKHKIRVMQVKDVCNDWESDLAHGSPAEQWTTAFPDLQDLLDKVEELCGGVENDTCLEAMSGIEAAFLQTHGNEFVEVSTSESCLGFRLRESTITIHTQEEIAADIKANPDGYDIESLPYEFTDCVPEEVDEAEEE